MIFKVKSYALSNLNASIFDNLILSNKQLSNNLFNFVIYMSITDFVIELDFKLFVILIIIINLLNIL